MKKIKTRILDVAIAIERYTLKGYLLVDNALYKATGRKERVENNYRRIYISGTE